MFSYRSFDIRRCGIGFLPIYWKYVRRKCFWKMKKSFEFLYYCLYRMFTLIKRVGEKDENLASSFFSILLSTTTITLFFPLRFIIPKGFFTPRPYDVLLKFTLGSIFIIWYFICKYYFLKKENYLRIIASYEKYIWAKTSQWHYWSLSIH